MNFIFEITKTYFRNIVRFSIHQIH
jgi:hypothetical protein